MEGTARAHGLQLGRVAACDFESFPLGKNSVPVWEALSFVQTNGGGGGAKLSGWKLNRNGHGMGQTKGRGWRGKEGERDGSR